MPVQSPQPHSSQTKNLNPWKSRNAQRRQGPPCAFHLQDSPNPHPKEPMRPTTLLLENWFSNTPTGNSRFLTRSARPPSARQAEISAGMKGLRSTQEGRAQNRVSQERKTAGLPTKHTKNPEMKAEQPWHHTNARRARINVGARRAVPENSKHPKPPKQTAGTAFFPQIIGQIIRQISRTLTGIPITWRWVFQ